MKSPAKGYAGTLTIGELRKRIKNIPDETFIYMDGLDDSCPLFPFVRISKDTTTNGKKAVIFHPLEK